MAKNVVVLGMQWGDEGKGKIVDMLTDHAAAVVRYQGGHNAGHTLIVDGKRTILRLIPSGILHPGVRCLIGHGVVVSPTALLQEIEELREKEVAVENRLRISPGCQLILPYHIAIDQAREQAKGELALGTTGRGIGPAYEDKVARRGLRLVDLADENYCSERLRELADYHNFILKNYYHQEIIDRQQVFDELCAQRESLLPLTEDITAALREVVISGGNIIFEGAQGTLLDVDVGTYPYVTSSNTTAGAVATGSGFGPRYIDEVWGVTKAYTTRVGAGPFPTELFDDDGQLMGKRGHEFGSVTGRARRCGWLDGVLMRRAIHLNSVTAVVLTKLDILDVFEKIRICIGYRCGKQIYDTAPIDLRTFIQCEPVYEEVPGWQQSTFGLTRYSQLPKAAQHYIRRIEELSGVPVTMISTGPERAQTIIRQHPFA